MRAMRRFAMANTLTLALSRKPNPQAAKVVSISIKKKKKNFPASGVSPEILAPVLYMMKL